MAHELNRNAGTRWVAAIAALLTLVVAFVLSLRADVDPEPRGPDVGGAATAPRSTRVSVGDREAWLQRLRAGGEVSFVEPETPSSKGDKVVAKIIGLGHLEGADLVTLSGFAESLYDLRAKQLADYRANMRDGNLRDLAEEAKMAVGVEVAMVVREMVKAGSYILLAHDATLPSDLADEVVSMGVEKDGQPMAAWFLVADAQSPAVAELRKYRDGLVGAWIEDLVQRFNSLPLAVRGDYHARQERLSNEGEKKWNAEDREFMRDWFPSRVWVDASSFLMTAAPGK